MRILCVFRYVTETALPRGGASLAAHLHPDRRERKAMVLVDWAAGDQAVRSSWTEPGLGFWRARTRWAQVLDAGEVPGLVAMLQRQWETSPSVLT